MWLCGRGTYRPVIHKGNFHHGLEHAIFYPVRLEFLLDLLEEVVIEILRLVTAHGSMEIGLVSFLCVC